MFEIAYINLEKRKDRKKALLQNLADFGFSKFNISRINAIEDKFGEIGCAKSHLLALTKLYTETVSEYLLVLEDDFRFRIHSEQLINILNSIKASKVKVDLMQLYALRVQPSSKIMIQYGKEKIFLYKVLFSQSCTAYLVQKRMAPKLINCFLGSLEVFENNRNAMHNQRVRGSLNTKFAIDNAWHSIQANGNSFVLDFEIGVHEEGYSDVQNRHKAVSEKSMAEPFGYNKPFPKFIKSP